MPLLLLQRWKQRQLLREVKILFTAHCVSSNWGGVESSDEVCCNVSSNWGGVESSDEVCCNVSSNWGGDLVCLLVTCVCFYTEVAKAVSNKKRVSWAEDHKLVQMHIFELDESERGVTKG